MLSCPQFLERLYDEDCRAALAGAHTLPEDVATHRRQCAGCQEEWELAAADAHALPLALADVVPVALPARLHKALGPVVVPASRPSVFDGSHALAWAAVGATAAVILAAGATMPPALASLGLITWSLLGAAVAAGASIARDALSEALG
jgi:hypothetical protein